MSTPTDPSVITALSAILDLDGRALFEKAGVPMPAEEAHSTVEQALASLAPLPLEEPIEDVVEPDPVVTAPDHLEKVAADLEPDLDADLELEAEVHEHLEESPEIEPESDLEPEQVGEPDPVLETFSPRPEPIQPEPVAAAKMRNTSDSPAFVSPPEQYLITAPTPPMVEPSYMEDSNQRQMYRVRNLATVVLVVALVIVLLWSLSNTVDAIGTWWDEFMRTLRL